MRRQFRSCIDGRRVRCHLCKISPAEGPTRRAEIMPMPGIRKTRTASAYRDLRQMEAWGASFGEVKGDVNSAIAFRLEAHPFIRSSALSTSKNKREIDFWLHWTLAFTEHGRAHCSTSSRHVTSSTSANILVWSHMASEWIYDAPYVDPIRRWLKSQGVA